MATKSPEATIDFLLTCLECTEGKTDWEKVAVKTGWYKAGKFSKQAFTSIQKKYGGNELGGATAGNAADTADKPKKTATKKRAAAAAENGQAKGGRTKKAKKEEDGGENGGEDESGGGTDD